MDLVEQAVTFECEREQLFGVLSLPVAPPTHGVLIVVGGPQYRAGSHRQFTLLARDFAARGIASLRFDYRGMGDSSGPAQSFENAGADIAAAIDRLLVAVPGLAEVTIWGLCDGASAALLYAHRDPRVSALVLLNPWVSSPKSTARVQLRHYYGRRLFHGALWRKVLRGEFNALRSAASFIRIIGDATKDAGVPAGGHGLPERMREGLARFRGRVLLVLSGRDMTAQEFRDMVAASPRWKALIGEKATLLKLPDADHTFSSRAWRDEVAAQTADWVKAGITSPVAQ